MMHLHTSPLAALEFASPTMAGWLAAAALPLLVNLWSRRRHVETDWAAVELLLAAVRERSRRLKLRELLLLALRTLVLIAAALAAMQPAWRRAGAATGGAERTHHVIVVDQSFSMATRGEDETRLARAKALARQLVEAAPTGDAFSVIAWSGVAENVLGRPTFEASSAMAAIDSLAPLDTVAELTAARRAVDAALEKAADEHPGLSRQRIVLLSDLGANTWTPVLDRRGQGAAASLLPAGAGVMSVDDGLRENLAITNIAVEPSSPVIGRPLEATVEVRSFGREPRPQASVELLVDGERIDVQQASVPAGGAATVRFETRLLDEQGHVLEARLTDDDVLSNDNRRWLSTVATPGARALCVADVEAAAADIARALNPRFRQAPAGGEIAVEIITASALAAAKLDAYDAVFLCNVEQLSSREARLLRRYVADGGALTVVLGDRIRPEAYNRFLEVSPPLSPIEISAQAASGEWRFDPLDYGHPLLQSFAGRARSGLLGVRIARLYPLHVAADAAATIALATTAGDPAIVINDYGRGRVAVLAVDPALTNQGESWTTLAVSPSFVPLMRELFAHLTADRRASRLNVIAGEADDRLPPALARTRGVHQLDDGSTIAVNVDASESDLTALSVSDLQLDGANRDRAARSADSYAGESTPLAGYLLATALALILVELTVAWLLGRGWA